jgi:hypothetical protein
MARIRGVDIVGGRAHADRDGAENLAGFLLLDQLLVGLHGQRAGILTLLCLHDLDVGDTDIDGRLGQVLDGDDINGPLAGNNAPPRGPDHHHGFRLLRNQRSDPVADDAFLCR